MFPEDLSNEDPERAMNVRVPLHVPVALVFHFLRVTLERVLRLILWRHQTTPPAAYPDVELAPRVVAIDLQLWVIPQECVQHVVIKIP